MANKLFKSLFAVAMVLGSALGFVACEEPNEVVGDPTVEVSTKSLNFTNEEGSQEVNITCNADWTATVDADWVTVAPAAGNKNGVITVAVSANETGALRTATVRVSAIHPQYNEAWDNAKITIQQSADENVTVTEELIYGDDFDGKEATKTYGSGSSWPYIDQFPEFANPKGDAAANVTYTGSGVSVRANSTSNSSYSDYAGSGSNNIFFGSNAYFVINNITPLEGVNYKVTFGTEKYTQDGDSTFRPEEFLMSVSKDGSKWVSVEYTYAGTEPGRWNVATANFTLNEVPEKLYIKFQATVASVYRLDDLKLFVGNGGQAIDLENGTEQPGGGNEGGNDGPNTPATGEYESDSAFVCASDDSANAAYSLGATTINGQAVTGFKLGKSKQAGKFVSGAVSVEGAKYLNFYAQGWKGGDVTLYFRVDGGATQSQKLASHDGVTGNPPYAELAFAETDHYSFLLEGLTAASKIEFSTDANFALTTADSTMASARAIVCGVKLSDEPIVPGEGGNTTPEPTPDPEPTPEPSDLVKISSVLAKGQGATLSGTIEAVVVSNLELNNLTSKKGMYVQDETGALQFYLAANHDYAFGTKLHIDLNGATLGAYNGAVQISGLALDKITVVSTGNTVEPKTVSMADFLANKYEGQYVAIEGVQVAESDLANTWVMGGAHTSINMEDAAGNKFVVFSSKYATYGAETVAQGAGVIKGISSINNGNMQIIFAQASDYAGLTGERLTGGNVTPEPEPTPDPTPEPEPTPGDSKTVVLNMADYFSEAEEIVGKTYTFGDFTFSFEQVNSNKSNFNAGDGGIRFYQSDVMTINAGNKTMTKIEFETYGGKVGPFTSNVGSVDGTTWTGSASSVELTAVAQVRFKKVTITFAE